jgi:hypothetical protein
VAQGTLAAMVLTKRTVNAGKDDYQIHLNFLPVETEGNTFIIYRRKRSHLQEQRPTPEAIAHKLPVSCPDEEVGLFEGAREPAF